MTAADRLGEIQARADKALAGPWEVNPFAHSVRKAGTSKVVCQLSVLGNAAFIAHARTDVPRLVAALRAVLDVCDGLEEAHRANPRQTYEYGPEEAAHQVRNAIEAALGEAS